MHYLGTIALVVTVAIGAATANAGLVAGGIPNASDPDLQLWLDADDLGTLTFGTGSGVLGWADKSTYGRDFQSSSTTDPGWVHSANHEPTSGLNQLNSRNVLYFGENDFLQTSVANALPSSARTMFFVYRPYATGFKTVLNSHDQPTGTGLWYAVADMEGEADGTWFQAGNGTWPAVFFSSDEGPAGHTVGSPRLASIAMDPTNPVDGTTLRADGHVLTNESGSACPGITVSQAVNPLTIGDFWDNIGNGNFNGDVAEILIYDRALDWEEFNAVGYYLQTKWDISGTYTPDPGTLLIISLGGGVFLRRKRAAWKH